MIVPDSFGFSPVPEDTRVPSVVPAHPYLLFLRFHNSIAATTTTKMITYTMKLNQKYSCSTKDPHVCGWLSNP